MIQFSFNFHSIFIQIDPELIQIDSKLIFLGSGSIPVGGSGGLKKRKKPSESEKLFSSGSERDETENISLSQVKKKNRRIKSKFSRNGTQ